MIVTDALLIQHVVMPQLAVLPEDLTGGQRAVAFHDFTILSCLYAPNLL